MSYRLIAAVLFVTWGILSQAAPAGEVARRDTPSETHNDRRIVFVCDASDSMVPKIGELRKDLTETIQGLRAIQSYNVLFMRAKGFAALFDYAEMATPANKDKGEAFINAFKPGGKTDPVPALEGAFKQGPGMIYLLADHDFPDTDKLLLRCRKLNKDHKTKIYTIALLGSADRDTAFLKVLKQIAVENDGVFKVVKLDDSAK